ncbi:MAG: PEGA domain-containing protein [Planctomycetes bacterium]|nr:PEGA domain-containing protein [Planctomycetota bacterium]
MPRLPNVTLPLALLAASAVLPGCMLFEGTTNVSIASDPPGARVLIDRRDSGFVTPCFLALDRGDGARIDLEYPGYVTATRLVTPDHQVYAILWSEMHVRPNVWNFPLWLNTRDLFVPIKWDKTMSPGRLYVKLERTADS